MARVYDTCLVLCSFVMCVLMRMRRDATGDERGIGVGGGWEDGRMCRYQWLNGEGQVCEQ